MLAKTTIENCKTGESFTMRQFCPKLLKSIWYRTKSGPLKMTLVVLVTILAVGEVYSTPRHIKTSANLEKWNSAFMKKSLITYKHLNKLCAMTCAQPEDETINMGESFFASGRCECISVEENNFKDVRNVAPHLKHKKFISNG